MLTPAQLLCISVLKVGKEVVALVCEAWAVVYLGLVHSCFELHNSNINLTSSYRPLIIHLPFKLLELA